MITFEELGISTDSTSSSKKMSFGDLGVGVEAPPVAEPEGQGFFASSAQRGLVEFSKRAGEGFESVNQGIDEFFGVPTPLGQDQPVTEAEQKFAEHNQRGKAASTVLRPLARIPTGIGNFLTSLVGMIADPGAFVDPNEQARREEAGEELGGAGQLAKEQGQGLLQMFTDVPGSIFNTLTDMVTSPNSLNRLAARQLMSQIYGGKQTNIPGVSQGFMDVVNRDIAGPEGKIFAAMIASGIGKNVVKLGEKLRSKPKPLPPETPKIVPSREPAPIGPKPTIVGKDSALGELSKDTQSSAGAQKLKTQLSKGESRLLSEEPTGKRSTTTIGEGKRRAIILERNKPTTPEPTPETIKQPSKSEIFRQNIKTPKLDVVGRPSSKPKLTKTEQRLTAYAKDLGVEYTGRTVSNGKATDFNFKHPEFGNISLDSKGITKQKLVNRVNVLKDSFEKAKKPVVKADKTVAPSKRPTTNNQLTKFKADNKQHFIGDDLNAGAPLNVQLEFNQLQAKIKKGKSGLSRKGQVGAAIGAGVATAGLIAASDSDDKLALAAIVGVGLVGGKGKKGVAAKLGSAAAKFVGSVKKAAVATSRVADRSVPKFIKQAKNLVEPVEAKKVLNQITVADEKWHRRAGQALDRLKPSILRKRLFKRNFSGEKIADMIENREAGVINKLMDEALFKMRALGIEVGRIGGKAKGYFPRIFKQDIAEALRNELKEAIRLIGEDPNVTEQALIKALKGKKTAGEIIEFHLKEGNVKTYSEAVRILERQASEQIFSNLSFLQKRSLTHPSKFYERDARKVIPWYLNAAAKRMAQVEVWGKDFERLEATLREINKVDPDVATMTRKLVNIWSGEFEKTHGLRGASKKVADVVTTFEFVTKIGSGLATIPNITQTFISTASRLGMTKSSIGLLRLLTKDGKKRVRQSGAINQNLLHSVTGRPVEGLLGKVTLAFGRLSGFTGINKFNMSLAASTAEVAIRKWHKQAQGKGKTAEFARRMLEGEFKIDASKPLTDKLILEKMYRFGTDSQLQRNILNDPLIFNAPGWRPLMIFKRFGVRQATFQKDALMRDFKNFKETKDVRFMLPALRLAGLGVAGGEFVIFAQNMIKQGLSGEPRYRKEDLLSMERLINDLVAVGSLGIVTEFMEFEESLPKTLSYVPGKVAFAVTPAPISDAIKIGITFSRFAEGWDKYGDPWLSAKKHIPVGISQTLGTIPRELTKRTFSDAKKKDRLERVRGNERMFILDAILKGDDKEATRRRNLWNDNHPEALFTSDDINYGELLKRAKSKAKTKQEASR